MGRDKRKKKKSSNPEISPREKTSYGDTVNHGRTVDATGCTCLQKSKKRMKNRLRCGEVQTHDSMEASGRCTSVRKRKPRETENETSKQPSLLRRIRRWLMKKTTKGKREEHIPDSADTTTGTICSNSDEPPSPQMLYQEILSTNGCEETMSEDNISDSIRDDIKLESGEDTIHLKEPCRAAEPNVCEKNTSTARNDQIVDEDNSIDPNYDQTKVQTLDDVSVCKAVVTYPDYFRSIMNSSKTDAQDEKGSENPHDHQSDSIIINPIINKIYSRTLIELCKMTVSNNDEGGNTHKENDKLNVARPAGGKLQIEYKSNNISHTDICGATSSNTLEIMGMNCNQMAMVRSSKGNNPEYDKTVVLSLRELCLAAYRGASYLYRYGNDSIKDTAFFNDFKQGLRVDICENQKDQFDKNDFNNAINNKREETEQNHEGFCYKADSLTEHSIPVNRNTGVENIYMEASEINLATREEKKNVELNDIYTDPELDSALDEYVNEILGIGFRTSDLDDTMKNKTYDRQLAQTNLHTVENYELHLSGDENRIECLEKLCIGEVMKTNICNLAADEGQEQSNDFCLGNSDQAIKLDNETAKSIKIQACDEELYEMHDLKVNTMDRSPDCFKDETRSQADLCSTATSKTDDITSFDYDTELHLTLANNQAESDYSKSDSNDIRAQFDNDSDQWSKKSCLEVVQNNDIETEIVNAINSTTFDKYLTEEADNAANQEYDRHAVKSPVPISEDSDISCFVSDTQLSYDSDTTKTDSDDFKLYSPKLQNLNNVISEMMGKDNEAAVISDTTEIPSRDTNLIEMTENMAVNSSVILEYDKIQEHLPTQLYSTALRNVDEMADNIILEYDKIDKDLSSSQLYAAALRNADKTTDSMAENTAIILEYDKIKELSSSQFYATALRNTDGMTEIMTESTAIILEYDKIIEQSPTHFYAAALNKADEMTDNMAENTAMVLEYDKNKERSPTQLYSTALRNVDEMANTMAENTDIILEYDIIKEQSPIQSYAAALKTADEMTVNIPENTDLAQEYYMSEEQSSTQSYAADADEMTGSMVESTEIAQEYDKIKEQPLTLLYAAALNDVDDMSDNIVENIDRAQEYDKINEQSPTQLYTAELGNTDDKNDKPDDIKLELEFAEDHHDAYDSDVDVALINHDFDKNADKSLGISAIRSAHYIHNINDTKKGQKYDKDQEKANDLEVDRYEMSSDYDYSSAKYLKMLCTEALSIISDVAEDQENEKLLAEEAKYDNDNEKCSWINANDIAQDTGNITKRNNSGKEHCNQQIYDTDLDSARETGKGKPECMEYTEPNGICGTANDLFQESKLIFDDKNESQMLHTAVRMKQKSTNGETDHASKGSHQKATIDCNPEMLLPAETLFRLMVDTYYERRFKKWQTQINTVLMPCRAKMTKGVSNYNVSAVINTEELSQRRNTGLDSCESSTNMENDELESDFAAVAGRHPTRVETRPKIKNPSDENIIQTTLEIDNGSMPSRNFEISKKTRNQEPNREYREIKKKREKAKSQ